MNQKYAQTIKELRKKRNLSQQDIAEYLSIARTSYIEIEKGNRELSLSEAHKLADYYGVTVEDIESGMIPKYEKYKEMILEYLRQAGSVTDGCIPKTKLAKLVYLADFAWFYEHLDSMSGMKYRKIEYGPVPDMYFRAITELEDIGLINVKRKDDAILISQSVAGKQKKLQAISSDEKKLIKKIARKWKNRRTNEIVAFTHQQLPYEICEENEIIPYALITQEDPEYVY